MATDMIDTLAEVGLAGVDVAITENGPVVLEVNLPGDFDLLQISSRRGVLSNPDILRLANRSSR